MDTKEKTLKDLEGWSPTVSMKGLWPWREGYTVFESPDRKMVAQVDMTDEEVVLIYNREEKKIEYIHPVTELGMKRTGITREQLEAGMAKMNEGGK
jgi:hypothetical protein